MVRERWDEWREGERRSAGGSEGRGEDDHSSLRRNLGWCGDRGRDCMDARRRRSGWGAAGRLPGTLFLQLVVLLLSAHAIQGMDVTVSATGTDDALLSSGATPLAIVEGEDTCADSSHCYISADAIQAAFASGNVTLSVTGAIHWSGAPTDGNPLSSSSSATLTLSCGDASVPTDGSKDM
ncbi:hypothetical protein T484DRAFT_1914863 [Baffinella frigidus]|nr:hypothetical protein T484DRAFT_1914863 [Cryptophyta sp. CCMP2293]